VPPENYILRRFLRIRSEPHDETPDGIGRRDRGPSAIISSRVNTSCGIVSQITSLDAYPLLRSRITTLGER
jgi:hypothetical protein